MPPGSWLLELNGASVKNYSHRQLARKVCGPGTYEWGTRASNITECPAFSIQLKQSGSKVTLLVASSAVEEFYRLHGLRVTAALADTSWLPFKVRELHMVKGPAGYGFLLKEDDCSSGGTGKGTEKGSLYLSKACLRVGNSCKPCAHSRTLLPPAHRGQQCQLPSG